MVWAPLRSTHFWASSMKSFSNWTCSRILSCSSTVDRAPTRLALVLPPQSSSWFSSLPSFSISANKPLTARLSKTLPDWSLVWAPLSIQIKATLPSCSQLDLKALTWLPRKSSSKSSWLARFTKMESLTPLKMSNCPLAYLSSGKELMKNSKRFILNLISNNGYAHPKIIISSLKASLPLKNIATQNLLFVDAVVKPANAHPIVN